MELAHILNQMCHEVSGSGLNPPFHYYHFGNSLLYFMRIIARRILREFWEKHPDTTIPLQTWFHDVERATWTSPADIRAVFQNASFLANNRVVFNIKGNRYRLLVLFVYQHGVVYIRFVGTHEEYDRIDAATI